MCGIAGFISDCEDAGIRLERMVNSLVHRGPDGQGKWMDVNAGIALAQTRLSIIDLSEAGRQPMSYMKGRFWITFNGEIYNYKEIRNILEKKGYAFLSNSDTEVILAGWAHWGTDLLSRLRGMFAFAIWDCKERCLALCRDRMGIKPLLYYELASGIVFASTLNALMISGFVEPEIEPQGVFDIFSTGSVCQPRTLLRGVQSLEPGSCLLYSPNSGKKTFRYWNLTDAITALKPEMSRLTYNDSVRHVRDLLEEACRYNLVSDVPVGSFLSGGIDSTAITALMSRQSAKAIKSFSIGFERTSNMVDERKDAKIAASHIGTDHTEVILTGRDVEAAYDNMICCIDQPSFDGANTYFVSRAASAHVKVAISGLGGDELFAGYEHFLSLKNVANHDAQWSDRGMSVLHRLRPNRWTQTAALRCMTVPQRYVQLRRGLTDSGLQKAFVNALLQHFSVGYLDGYIAPLLNSAEDSVTQTSLIECRHYLLNTLLRDADAMSMGQGLEVRPLLLDHPLVEHALALPSNYKLQGSRYKAVLKDAVADLLPPSLLTRQKTGFTLPMDFWLQTSLRPRLLDALNGCTARSFFKPAFLKECHKNINNTYYARTLWTLLVFVSWYR